MTLTKMKNTCLGLMLLWLSMTACKNDTGQSNAAAQQPATINSQTVTTNDYIIESGKRIGIIHAGTTYDDLVREFGKDNLQEDIVMVAEGTEEKKVTYIRKDDLIQELVVFWVDSAYHQKVDWVQVAQDKSRYRTRQSIGIGSSLSKLEEINGKPLSFYGFGWDYGGTITSFNGGFLDSMGVHYYLHLDVSLPKNMDNTTFLMGDKELFSSDKNVSAWKDSIKVQTIEVSFTKGVSDIK
jgi:hypothetical protein